MVEQLKKWNLLVKLSLSLHHEGKSPIVKRVMVADYANLLDAAKKLGNNQGVTDA